MSSKNIAQASKTKLERYPHQIGVGGLLLSDYEKKLVNEVLESNRLTYGPMSQRFEKDFAALHDCAFGLYMNSGTSALQIALAALKEVRKWKDGDEVLVPSITFVATSNVVMQNNLKPVFVDVDRFTFNINAGKIEEKITPRTRAIMPVHLLGLPAEMGPIMEIAKKYSLAVVEDSAECMFAKFGNKSVGSFGDIGCFSTYVAHFLVTGVGGFATTNDPALACIMRSLMNHGRNNIYISCSDDEGAQGERLQEIIQKRFMFERVGYSYRCTEMEAAIGVGQLNRKDQIISRRKEIADRFTQELSYLGHQLQLPSCPPDRTHTYMLYGLCTRNEEKTNLVNYLEELNIETRDLLPLLNQPIYKEIFGDIEKDYPEAHWINRHGFYIGCHSYMTDDEVDFVIEAIQAYYRN